MNLCLFHSLVERSKAVDGDGLREWSSRKVDDLYSELSHTSGIYSEFTWEESSMQWGSGKFLLGTICKSLYIALSPIWITFIRNIMDLPIHFQIGPTCSCFWSVQYAGKVANFYFLKIQSTLYNQLLGFKCGRHWKCFLSCYYAICKIWAKLLLEPWPWSSLAL